MTYPHQQIEEKWQKIWEETKAYRTDSQSGKPPFYVLDMFPFPSGAGLHVGHVVGYAASDIYSRFKRQKGFEVLHPMGWDSFGLPAEQYAVRTGQHPQETTKKNVETYKRQLKSLGFSYDWDREFATSDPDYYRWTQWIFTKLYDKGLAYQADVQVNWCEALGTALANEEIEEGRAKEGGHPVVRKPLKQWVLKITEYADRLLEDLEDLDWSDGLKKLQKNWIGKSEGALIAFQEQTTQEAIEVFTTCAHTVFGVTFLVLAPEHPLVAKITTLEQKDAVDAYVEKVRQKSDLERQEDQEHKTGVFTGAYATHPMTGGAVPIWIADYVLVSYGTGAVMAVPAHDERDFAFANRFSLPIQTVVDPQDRVSSQEREAILSQKACYSGPGILIHSASFDGLSSEQACLAITEDLESKNRGKKKTTYRLRDWVFSRQRYWGEPFPILHFPDGSKRTLDLDELPLLAPPIEDYTPSGDGRSPLAKVSQWVEIIDPKTGKPCQRETDTMPNWAGSCWYYLRFCDPRNSEALCGFEEQKRWLPVDLYIGGTEHAVLHLLYARFWHKVLYDLGLVSSKEPFKKLVNQGLVVARSYQNHLGAYVSPHDVVEKEGQYIHRQTQEVLRSQIEKMSKSKLNGESPDEIIQEYGADALRLYEMFMGPIDKERYWNTDAVQGCRRFLQRFMQLCLSDKVVEECSEEALRLSYRLVEGVQNDLEALQFHTAIAKMMEFLNHFQKLTHYPKTCILWAIQCLYPFAPHLSSELYQRLGFTGDLQFLEYPNVDPQYLIDPVVTYIIQINGKLRARFDLPLDHPEQELIDLALSHPKVQKHLINHTIRKTIFVPNKLINFVVL